MASSPPKTTNLPTNKSAKKVDKEWHLISSIKELKGAMDIINQSAEEFKTVAVDLEGDLSKNGKLSLIQVGLADGKAFIFDVYICPELVSKGLAKLFVAEEFVKVMHDCRQDSVALKSQFGITLSNVLDTQVAHAILQGKDPKNHRVGLNAVMQAYGGKVNSKKKEVKHRPGLWETRPLTPTLLQYAAEDVKYLVAVSAKMFQLAKAQGSAEKIFKASMENVRSKLNTPAQMLTESANAFLAHLDDAKNSTLRLRCEDRTIFSETYNAWKKQESEKHGRVWRGSPSTVLFYLSRMKGVNFKVRGNAIQMDKKLGSLASVIERVNANRAALENDKGGISVSKVAFSQVVPLGGSTVQQIEVTNNGSKPVTFVSAKLLRTDNGFSIRHEKLPETLPPNSKMVLHVSCEPKHPGLVCSSLSLCFNGFAIARFLEVRCGDAELLDELKPTAPFQRAKRGKKASVPLENLVLPPADDDKASFPKMANPLPKFDIPRSLKNCLELGELKEMLEKGHAKLLSASSGGEMTPKEYSNHFHSLLWLEEMQLVDDLTSFDRTSVLDKRERYCLALQVAGLAEKRPSVLKGDYVQVTHGKNFYAGRATYIHREEVGLRFHDTFHSSYITGSRVEIRFRFGRTPMRIFHQGVTQSEKLRREILFPTAPLQLRPARFSCDRLVAINREVGNNPEQMQAVKEILVGEGRGVPYNLFGPPGTGKTTTLVEVVAQAVRNQQMPKDFRVLICTPTNTACDVVCEKLADPKGPITSSSEMLRMNAYSRNKHEVPRAVMPFTNLGPHDDFETPNWEIFKEKRIVITTLCLAGKLHNAVGIPRGHFDMIIIDEAGQATEPEAVAAVSLLLDDDGQLVLGGDVKQLGPVIHSNYSKGNGLDISLMERLMSFPLYQQDKAVHPSTNGYDSRMLTKLLRNFRSHPELLKIPNRLFYGDELLCCADEDYRNNCLHWEGLANPAVPMMFHGVEGKDDREENSPSWFNADEAVCVLKVMESLLRMRHNAFKPEDIGIITPYNKQAHKIKGLLRRENYADAMVGSVEMLQGQERRAIIISTVRSSREHISFDRKHNIGFLDSPKRFNVAITRAACLLVVVGNPAVLAGDPNWGALLRSCVEQGAYVGVPLPKSFARGGEDSNVGSGGGAASQKEEEELCEAMETLLAGGLGESSERMQQEGLPMPEYDA